jgi:hypothetical protein
LLRKLFPHGFPLPVKSNNLFSEKQKEKNVRKRHQVENGVVDSAVYRNTIVTSGFSNGFAHRALGIGAQRKKERECHNEKEDAVRDFHEANLRIFHPAPDEKFNPFGVVLTSNFSFY